ncbi:MAG: alpha/beta hydrolase [Phycisphaerae bacterium]|nr:alpha/beta hydrolase [Phycisphaerae bacterium]
MAIEQVNGIKMHYMVKGDGPDVVLIHGVTSTLAVWFARVLPALSENYRVLAYDLRGHGYSQATPTGYTSHDLAHDLNALLEHVGVGKARIIGHSFGGSIALQLAAHFPERVAGVVLSDTGIACLRHLRTLQEWHGWETWKGELAEFGINYEWFLEADGGDVAEVFRRGAEIPNPFALRQNSALGKSRLKRLIEETSITRDFRQVAGLTEERLAHIAAPVLALYGGTSPFSKLGPHLAGLMPRCRCDMLSDTGHYTVVDSAEVFLSAIAEFLRDPDGYVGKSKQGV